MIPLAVLIGIMFVVAEKTFEWGTLKLFGKVPKKDIFVGLLVGGITVIADLAIAVITGVIVSALIFAWEHAKQIYVKKNIDKNGTKIYQLNGTLFFASITEFNNLFDIKNDPEKIIIDFMNAKVMDHSALIAIDNLAEKYQKNKKKLCLKHLSPDCYELLEKAKGMIEINLVEDPQYHVADDKIN
jgi:SulP family sulfate permease